MPAAASRPTAVTEALEGTLIPLFEVPPWKSWKATPQTCTETVVAGTVTPEAYRGILD